MIYFEDLEVGAETDFGLYEVTREEMLEFARKYDPQPFHLSDEEAAKTHFGRMSASGWHTAAMTMAVIARYVVGAPPGGPRLTRDRRAPLAQARLSRRHSARARQDHREDAVAKPPGDGLLPNAYDRNQSKRRDRDDLHLDRADPAAAVRLVPSLRRVVVLPPIFLPGLLPLLPNHHPLLPGAHGVGLDTVERVEKPLQFGLVVAMRVPEVFIRLLQ